jgi:ribosomal-protein-alanine N-acetyltransferase
VTAGCLSMAPAARDVEPAGLRAMRRADLDAVMAIERRVFPQPWSRGFFEKELTTPFARLTVAIHGEAPAGDRVVGYSVHWRVADEVHLLNVAVHPDRQACGIGRRLVDAVVDESRGQEARAIFLEVRAGNVSARRLYGRLGFRDIGIRRGYYGPGQDAIVMELKLFP